MPELVSETPTTSDLRSRAASRLAGPAATKGSVAGSAGALAVLHALASSPDTASDALALLHELQVHQVELELQAQELQESRAALESALRRQTELYDLQPVGCFTIDQRWALNELNQAGADLLGIERDLASGLRLGAFLSADSVHRFRSALSQVDAGARRAACLLSLPGRRGADRAVLAHISADRTAGRYLLNLSTGWDEEARS